MACIADRCFRVKSVSSFFAHGAAKSPIAHGAPMNRKKTETALDRKYIDELPSGRWRLLIRSNSLGTGSRSPTTRSRRLRQPAKSTSATAHSTSRIAARCAKSGSATRSRNNLRTIKRTRGARGRAGSSPCSSDSAISPSAGSRRTPWRTTSPHARQSAGRRQDSLALLGMTRDHASNAHFSLPFQDCSRRRSRSAYR